MTTITHPLPVGTRVYYEDLAGCTGTIVHNDNMAPEFAAAVLHFNEKIAPTKGALVSEMDYLLRVDADDDATPGELLPIQASCVQRVL